MTTETSGATTEPQQITVEQLAAQLSRKASPGAKAEGPKPEAGAPDPETTAAEEAPVTEATGTEPDLFQSASTTDESGTAGDEAGSEAEAEPEGGAEAEAEAGAKPPEWFQKRVAKFTAKQKELEDRLAAAEKRAEESTAKLDEARRDGKPTKAWNFQEQQLQQQLGHKREVLRWAEENPDGATLTDAKGNEVSYSPEQMRAIKLSALEDLGDLRGQLRDHQQSLASAQAHWNGEALKAYPALKDPNSEESKNIELILEKLPWLREVPDARMSLADMLAGRAARLKKASGAPAAPTKPTRVPAAASAAPSRSAEAGPSQEVKQANDTFFQTGRTTDLARRFAAERKV